MAKLTVYQKKTCITCKKALAWLDAQGADYTALDIETTPPDATILEKLIDANGVKASLNSRSKLYKEKKLGDKLPDKATAIKLMQQDPNLIKRPVVVKGKQAAMGFDETALGGLL
ncbi:MAG: arsenate reductase family protein [Candidatus Melainabacteria bacterium]